MVSAKVLAQQVMAQLHLRFIALENVQNLASTSGIGRFHRFQ